MSRLDLEVFLVICLAPTGLVGSLSVVVEEGPRVSSEGFQTTVFSVIGVCPGSGRYCSVSCESCVTSLFSCGTGTVVPKVSSESVSLTSCLNPWSVSNSRSRLCSLTHRMDRIRENPAKAHMTIHNTLRLSTYACTKCVLTKSSDADMFLII